MSAKMSGRRTAVKILVAILRAPESTIDQKLEAARIIERLNFRKSKKVKRVKPKKSQLLG